MAITKRRGYVPQEIEPKWQKAWAERGVLRADELRQEGVHHQLGRVRREGQGDEGEEARDRADPGKVADRQDPRGSRLGPGRRPPLAPVGAREIRHRVVRVPGPRAVPPRPLRAVAAEDADAREPAQQAGRPAVGMHEERELARPRDEGARPRVVAAAQVP